MSPFRRWYTKDDDMPWPARRARMIRSVISIAVALFVIGVLTRR